MKTLIIAIAIVIGMVVVLELKSNLGEVVYHNTAEEVIIDNTPEWAKDEDARKAAEAVIERKALEAELSQLESEIATRQARVDEIEKELSF